MPSAPAGPDLAALLESWTVHLRAERKSPQTVKSYTAGVRQFLDWCAARGVPVVLDRTSVNAFVAALLDSGVEAATARARQLAVRRFSAWCTDEGEIARDELLGLKPPKLDVKVVPRLTDDQCRALVKACTGREFRDRRDEAIIRFMLEAIVRAGEVVAMRTTDVDITLGIAVVQRGKGGKGRPVPFGAQTGHAIDRYLRMRRTHRLADTPALWLGDRGKSLSYDGLYVALRHRAELAGIPPTSIPTSPGTPPRNAGSPPKAPRAD
ncbi:MAG: tyrosine-type recombinase/integrase [Pseudonocardiales bacterium]|nr:tyrosine-type recombinase/integrase [Pseudonocardiales bacterium]MBV9730371.1 tyrosine-type recombinase/integrase [Pseudonocardiales bacterium]